MGYYEAKFARQAKPKPKNWLIIPVGLNQYKLENVPWLT